MAIFLLLAFIITPMVEIGVFIQVGGLIGLWPTLAIVVLTAIVGTALLRAQGLATFVSAQNSLARGEFPVRQVFDGACLLVAGALLLTPGFVTDAIGFALFLPPVRGLLRRWLMSRMEVRTHGGGAATPPNGRGEDVIEGTFHEVDEERGAEPPRRKR